MRFDYKLLKIHKLHKIFNKDTIKISYSCMPNARAIIEGNNKKKMQIEESKSVGKQCSCPRIRKCLLQVKCLSRNITYQATVKCEDNEETYVGLTATDFKSTLKFLTLLNIVVFVLKHEELNPSQEFSAGCLLKPDDNLIYYLEICQQSPKAA